MARRWSGFLPQNLNTKEEWDLLEACKAKAAQAQAEQEAPANGRAPVQSDGRLAASGHSRRAKR